MILLDDREKPDVLGPIQRYLTSAQMPHEVSRLATGDFLIICDDGRAVVVEHKRIRDLFQSIQTGVLLDECTRMLDAFDNVHLLIHGQTMQATKFGETMISPLGKGLNQVVYHAIDNRRVVGQLSAVQRAGVVVDWWPLWGQVGHYLRFLKQSYERSEHDSQIIRPRFFAFQRSSGVAESIRRLAIPGVGAEKAKAVGERFSTVRELANAGVDELKAIDGVGPKLAKNIHDFFGEEAA